MVLDWELDIGYLGVGWEGGMLQDLAAMHARLYTQNLGSFSGLPIPMTMTYKLRRNTFKLFVVKTSSAYA